MRQSTKVIIVQEFILDIQMPLGEYDADLLKRDQPLMLE